MNILKISLLFSLFLAGLASCNNQRNNRLSATFACDSAFNSVDPTAFELTEKQSEIFTKVDPGAFPDSEALAVRSVVSTFELALENEDKITIRTINPNPQADPNNTSIQCVRGLKSLDISEQKEISIPISNKDGKIQLKRFRVEIGNSQREDLTDFIRITALNDEVTEAGEVSEPPTAAPPVPFTSYFSSPEDQVAFYRETVKEDDDRSEEEVLKDPYYIHYKNDAERVRSRIVVSRFNSDDDKK